MVRTAPVRRSPHGLVAAVLAFALAGCDPRPPNPKVPKTGSVAPAASIVSPAVPAR